MDDYKSIEKALFYFAADLQFSYPDAYKSLFHYIKNGHLDFNDLVNEYERVIKDIYFDWNKFNLIYKLIPEHDKRSQNKDEIKDYFVELFKPIINKEFHKIWNVE